MKTFFKIRDFHLAPAKIYMEILHDFGFDPKLFAAQIVNFLLILFVMRRFFYKPILEMLHKRQKSIEEGVIKAQEAEKLFEKAAEKEKVILKKAQDEAKKMITEVKEQRNIMLKEAEIDAKKQAETIMKEARDQITYEAKETEKRLAKHIAELSVNILQKSLVGVFSKKEQDIILKNALVQVKKQSN